MSHRIHRIAASLVLTLAATTQALALTAVSPVRPVFTPSPSLPQLKVCYTQVSVSSSTSRVFVRPCASFEAAGTIRLG